ncbi:MAG: hypothetical protein ABF792_08670 [Bifidobacterium psychraerophilum]|uniref:hypothetical protein n=1 Tax=Bifidobacterium psychraerophilum TaxID=218140 RepID=UPI0039E9D69D
MRSGKTVGELLYWVKYCLHGPEGLLLIGGRTERTIANNLIYPLVQWFGPKNIVYRQSTGICTIFGRECLVVGFNVAQAHTKIQGLTLAGALLDEAAVIPESAFTMLVSHLNISNARRFLIFDPEYIRELKKQYTGLWYRRMI